MVKQLSFLILLAFGWVGVRASHLVGGELYYDNLGNGSYNITLKLYRDCNCLNCAGFGQVEYISIYTANGTLLQQLGLPFPGSQTLSSTITNPCLVATDVCVEQAVYTGSVNLPPVAGGYTLIYQRCCRNSSVNNILQDQGATYVAQIPGSDVVANSTNSSPRFKNFPPIFICNNAPLVFDHSATDPDGNVLRYSLAAPFDGATSACPDPSPATQQTGCQTTPYPYSSVIYTGVYEEKNPMNNPPNTGVMRIDSVTGYLTVTPNQQGQFVVGVKVDEYKNGVLLSSVTRDFQFNVVQCNIPIAELPATSFDPATGIGIYKVECTGNSIPFSPIVYNPPPTSTPVTVMWDFGVQGSTTDTSTALNPTYTYADTGTYLVTLIVRKEINGDGCYDTTRAFVKVYPVFIPDFNFGFNVADTCQGFPTVLQDATITTSGNVTAWNWDFGDGTSSNQANPVKTYAAAGSFDITLTVENARGCKGSSTKKATIFPKPDADFSASAVCINQPTVFTDASSISGGSIVTYDWSFDNIGTSTAHSPVFAFPTTGSKTIRLALVSDKGCVDTLVKTVAVNPLPIVNATPKLVNLCPGKTAQLLANGGTTYVWFPSSGLDNASLPNPVLTAGDTSITYTVQVTDANGCINKDSIRLEIYPLPTIEAGSDTSVCLSAGSFRDSVMLVATGGVTYVWSPATGLSDATVFNPVSRPLANTTYYVTGTDLNGCSNIDSVNVYFLDPNLNLILEDEKPICVGQEGTVTVVDQGSSAYLWMPANYVSNPTIFNPKFTPPVTTDYVLRITNYCYTKTDTVTISVLDLPEVEAGNDTSIYRDLPVFLNGTTTGSEYYWFPGDNVVSPFNVSTLAYPEKSQWYYLYALNRAGCVAVDSMFVTVVPFTQLLLPTGFSPNGDGVNDVFRIVRSLNIKELKWFRVFNRWGQLVFETNRVEAGWDGQFKGEPQPLSTYVWTLRAITKDGEEINESGNVTLVR